MASGENGARNDGASQTVPLLQLKAKNECKSVTYGRIICRLEWRVEKLAIGIRAFSAINIGAWQLRRRMLGRWNGGLRRVLKGIGELI